jgi:hypothetical protein
MKRIPLTRSMDLDTTINIMAEGHAPTKKLLKICAEVDHMLLLHCDDMNLRGLQLWAAYYGWCEGTFARFQVCVVNRDLAMIGYVNQGEWSHRAVPRGGAPR